MALQVPVMCIWAEILNYCISHSHKHMEQISFYLDALFKVLHLGWPEVNLFCGKHALYKDQIIENTGCCKAKKMMKFILNVATIASYTRCYKLRH